MRTIITVLHDDSAIGIKTIEFSNRLIKGIYIPRVDLKNLSKFNIPEIQYSWVYFLIWENDDNEQQVYIGQAVNIQKRLEQHSKNEEKDFWQYAIAFSNKEASLTESDINYLEKKLIQKTIEAGRAKIENKSNGNSCLIPHHRKADMKDFLDDLEILLGSLWFLFLQAYHNSKNTQEADQIYHLTLRWSNAQGLFTQEGFLVLKGSIWPKEMASYEIKHKWYSFRNRPNLIEKGVIKENGGSIIFLQDYLFKSPSGASCIIAWTSSNGRKDWKNKQGKTLDEIERSN